MAPVETRLYTGDVVVGGPAQVRHLRGLDVTKQAVGPYDNNVYLLECTSSRERMLIDAAAEAPTILDLIGERGVGQIVTTHYHYDHWGALAEVVTTTGATTLMHPADAAGVGVPTHIEIRHGDTVHVGDVELRVIHLVGHTLGSVVLAYHEPGGRYHLWTGDALFPGGVGKTHAEPDLFGLLYHGVLSRIFDNFPDDTWIYPGHGADTMVGAERPHLTEWAQRGS